MTSCTGFCPGRGSARLNRHHLEDHCQHTHTNSAHRQAPTDRAGSIVRVMNRSGGAGCNAGRSLYGGLNAQLHPRDELEPLTDRPKRASRAIAVYANPCGRFFFGSKCGSFTIWAGNRFCWPSSLPISTAVPSAAIPASTRASAMFLLRSGERVLLVTTPTCARPI